MTNAVTTPISFEDKLKTRIKESIGELVSDEDLKKLVDRGLEETFFQLRPNPAKGYYSSSGVPDKLPPLLQEILKESLQPIVTKCVNEYISNHKEDVLKEVNNVINLGMGEALVKAITSQFSSQMLLFQSNIQNQLNGMR